MPTEALLTFGILKLTSLILIEYEEYSQRLGSSLGKALQIREVDGYDGIEGVGSTAGQRRRRIAELDADSVYVVE